MANRVFQSVIYQMKDAINRVVGVVDEDKGRERKKLLAIRALEDLDKWLGQFEALKAA
jgi:hypothetical protein